MISDIEVELITSHMDFILKHIKDFRGPARNTRAKLLMNGFLTSMQTGNHQNVCHTCLGAGMKKKDTNK